MRPGARRVALASLLVSAAMAALKLGVGAATGSLAVLGDALQATLDVGATAVTLYAIRLADKPADARHPFGHGRAENLAALGQSVLLFGLGAMIGLAAVRRIASGSSVRPAAWAVAFIALSILVDFVRSSVLRRAARRYDSQALEGDALNFTADVAGSLAVLAGLVSARLGFALGDPVAALAVVGLVWAMGARLLLGAVNVLMDAAPAGVEQSLREVAQRVDGVIDVDDVRVRKSGPHSLAEVTVRVGRTDSVERSHDIAEAVRDSLAREVPGTSAVVRVAPSEVGEDVVRRVLAAANRVGMADQVHNILAVSHAEGAWLMMHAKVDPLTPLARAHEVADLLEAELRREVPGLARVEIHLEPRESQSVHGRVVSLERPDLVRELAEIAERHPPIERCHEVALSEVTGGLHVVLHCEADGHRTIEEIHDASLLVEAEVHSHFPDVKAVTVHFEPA